MTPLGKAVYNILRRRAELAEPRVTYAALAAQLRESHEDFDTLNHRSQQLYAALTEVGKHCRKLKLPSLPALVVRADTKRPGSAYFAGKCGGIALRREQIGAWWNEVEAVKLTRYPACK
jgi:hypothetical protein